MTTPLTPEEEQAMRTLRSWYGLLRLFATLDQVRTERDALQVDLGSVRELLRAAREERDVAERSAAELAAARAEAGRYARALGRIEAALGLAGSVPLDETVSRVLALVGRERLEPARPSTPCAECALRDTDGGCSAQCVAAPAERGAR